jgi:hypothetical protein
LNALFRTVVPVVNPVWQISYADKLLFTGSCFAENMGALMLRSRFDAVVNPHGILFNPISVARGIEDLLIGRKYVHSDLYAYNGLFMSLRHHGRFNDSDADRTLAAINTSILTGSSQLMRASVLVITWGSAWAYRWIEDGSIAANCHKIPKKNFAKVLLSHDEITGTWNKLITDLISINPSIKIVLTISPVRHWKDGAKENQLAKSHLIIAADHLCQRHENVSYFPSYEIMLDELRDYRFYKEDMLHPNDVAVNYIWQRLGQNYFSSDTLQKLAAIEPLLRYLEHRPLHTSAEAHESLCAQKEKEIRAILEQ